MQTNSYFMPEQLVPACEAFERIFDVLCRTRKPRGALYMPIFVLSNYLDLNTLDYLPRLRRMCYPYSLDHPGTLQETFATIAAHLLTADRQWRIKVWPDLELLAKHFGCTVPPLEPERRHLSRKKHCITSPPKCK